MDSATLEIYIKQYPEDRTLATLFSEYKNCQAQILLLQNQALDEDEAKYLTLLFVVGRSLATAVLERVQFLESQKRVKQLFLYGFILITIIASFSLYEVHKAFILAERSKSELFDSLSDNMQLSLQQEFDKFEQKITDKNFKPSVSQTGAPAVIPPDSPEIQALIEKNYDDNDRNIKAELIKARERDANMTLDEARQRNYEFIKKLAIEAESKKKTLKK